MEDPKSAGYTNKRQQKKKKLKEPDLTLNEQFFQAMFESHMAVMLLIDPVDGSIIDANKAAVNFYKYNREELQQMNIYDINLMAPDEVKAEWMKALRDERNYFEFPHKLANGEIRQVEVYSSAFIFQGKSILSSIIHDITEKKLAEETLIKTEEKFEAAFRSNPNAILLTDMESGIIYEANETFYSLTGLQKWEVLGKSTLKIDLYIDPDDRNQIINILKEKGSFKNRELKIRHRSGKIIHMLISAEVLSTLHGQTMITTMQDITERKLLEEKQKKEHDLLQIIFETVPAMISIYDPDISRVYLNSETEKITGWTRKDFEETNIMELVYPDPEYRQEVVAYMQSLEPGYKEIKMVCRDGSVKDTLWANVAMKDGRQIGIGIDITEHKKAQQELLQSRSIITAALESMTDAVYVSDTTGKIIEYNDAFFSFYRMNRKDSYLTEADKYHSLFDFYLPDGKPAAVNERPIPLALQGNKASGAEYLITRNSTGETWSGSYSFSPIYDADNIITGAVVVARDITDIKVAEQEKERLIQQLALEKEALAESEQKYRIMGEAIDYGVWATDAEGKVTYLSESFCNLVGKSFQDLKENGWHEHLIIEQSHEVMDLWMHSVKTGEPYEHEHQIKSKDGEIRYILARARPIRNNKGEITSWAGIHIDITERKKINQQLAEQNKNLTKINEVLEDFVHIAAHDLRSPIANLIQINELIATREDIESKMSMFGMLLPITQRLQRTVEGLLETVSLQTQDDDIIQNIRFSDVWNEVSEELKTEIENYTGEIRVDFKDAPKIRYVRMHLVSIMRNLVSNALKYSSGTTQPFIELSSRYQENFVLFTVADNGIGIDLEKENENLFKPFRRFTKKAEGTGLGLYIIKNIIEKNGGYIHLESQPNVGTTFHCYLKEYPEGNHA
jgi:PAS domain S-box-containing protein